MLSLVLVAALAYSIAPPAGAEETPRILREYQAWRFHADEGATFHVEAKGDLVQGSHLAFGFWLWRTGNTNEMFYFVGAVATSTMEVYAHTDHPPGFSTGLRSNLRCTANYALREFVDGCRGMAARAEFQIPYAGEWNVVAMGATDDTWVGGISLVSSNGTRILGTTSGAVTFVTPAEFGGEWATGHSSRITVRLARGAEVGMPVEGALFGYFWVIRDYWAPCVNELDAEWEGPPGRFTGSRTFRAEPAGDYTFRVSAMTVVCPDYLMGPWLFAADVQLP